MECKWFLSQRLKIPWDTILIFFDKNRRDNDRKKWGGGVVWFIYLESGRDSHI